MKFYRIAEYDFESKPQYFPTRDLAKDAAVELKKIGHWNDGRLELVEIATDQKTLASILSGWGCEIEVLRTWTLTSRGGLKEVENGE